MTLAVLTLDLLGDPVAAKTAHGILRYGEREVVAVVDTRHAGRRTIDVVPFALRDAPVVATIEEAVALGARAAVFGIAPAGGRLDDASRAALVAAAANGLDVSAGLHTRLEDDPVIAQSAAGRGTLHDLRAVPADLRTLEPGDLRHRSGLRVVLTVGADCAVGKKVTAIELAAAGRRAGLRAVFVPTGQTGVAIAGWGLAIDHVVADFVAGAAARLVDEGAARGDLLFIEGQGALVHPAYSGVTLGLLHGSAPDALVLVVPGGRHEIDGFPGTPIPPVEELIALYERVGGTRVVAVSVNTRGLDIDAARRAVHEVRERTGLPAADPIADGPEPLLSAVLDHLALK